MKQVEFIEVRSKLNGFGFGKGTEYIFDGVTDIIKNMIEQGWEYKGYVPIETRGTGEVSAISLIFEKDSR